MFILLYVVSFLPSSISFCLTYVTFLQVREPDIFQQLVVCGGLSFFNLYSNIMLYTCISTHFPPPPHKKKHKYQKKKKKKNKIKKKKKE